MTAAVSTSLAALNARNLSSSSCFIGKSRSLSASLFPGTLEGQALHTNKLGRFLPFGKRLEDKSPRHGRTLIPLGAASSPQILHTGAGGNDGSKDSGGGGGGGDGHGSGGDFEHGGSEASGPFRLWLIYLALLDKHPLQVKAITSALLNLLGDLVCQIVVELSEAVDLKRAAVLTTLGLVLVGPTLHFWYALLNNLVTATGTTGAVIRLVADQAVFSPIFISVFFAALFTLEGRPGDIVPKLKQDLATTVVNNWKVWIPFQFLNFRYVPPRLQVGVANIIALLWNVYLSFATHTAVKAT